MSDAAGDGKPKKKARWRNRSAWTVFLTNLDYSSDAAAVREFVEELKVLSGSAPAVAPADLVDVRLAADKGRSKGIGFVELATDEACARLIAAFGDKGVEMEGRVLKASMCDPAKEKKQRKDKATAAAAAGAGGDEPTKKRRRTRDGDDADAAAAKKPHREPREPHEHKTLPAALPAPAQRRQRLLASHVRSPGSIPSGVDVLGTSARWTAAGIPTLAPLRWCSTLAGAETMTLSTTEPPGGDGLTSPQVASSGFPLPPPSPPPPSVPPLPVGGAATAAAAAGGATTPGGGAEVSARAFDGLWVDASAAGERRAGGNGQTPGSGDSKTPGGGDDSGGCGGGGDSSDDDDTPLAQLMARAAPPPLGGPQPPPAQQESSQEQVEESSVQKANSEQHTRLASVSTEAPTSPREQVESLQKVISEQQEQLASVMAAAQSAQEQMEYLQNANTKQHEQLASVTAAAQSAREQIESLELANADLRRQLDRPSPKEVIDVEANDEQLTQRQVPNNSLQVCASIAEAAVRVKKERDDHQSQVELLDSIVLPLEEQRRQLQELVTGATRVLLDAKVPSKRKSDSDAPFYYCSKSYTSWQDVPWNEKERRPMALEEAVQWALAKPG